MSMGEIDISWQTLRRIVQDWKGTAAELMEFRSLHGGQINTTVELHLSDGTKAVVKVSQHRVDKSYEREAHQLTILKKAGIPVPEVYSWRIGSLDDPVSHLLIEHIEGTNLGEARHQCTHEEFEHLQQDLAAVVARMHDHCSDNYMRLIPGGESFADWPTFYRSVYDPIWREAEKDPHISKHCRKQIGRVHDHLDRYIAHDDKPRLVHFDLWNTNVMVRRDDETAKWKVAALLDPNCKYAHSEAEIAYLELFHTVTPSFMKAYQQRHKLPAEYHKFRKPIYQLYPLINHVQLYGANYSRLLAQAVERTEHLA